MVVAHRFYNFRVNTISGSWQTPIQRLIKVKDKSFKGNKFRFIKNSSLYHFHFSYITAYFWYVYFIVIKIFLFYEMILKPASWSVWAAVTKYHRLGGL